MSNPDHELNLAADGSYVLMPGTPDSTVVPAPSRLAALLRGHIEADVEAMRALIEQRGGITASSDVYSVLRYLAATNELLGEHVRLIKTVQAETIKPLIEEVLADGVGADSQGNPVASLTVPDQHGDIKITRRSRNAHSITPEMILPAFASMFADQHVDAILDSASGTISHSAEERAQVGVAVAEAVLDALNNVNELGKFEPQVTKVRAYADHLARTGQDNAAGIVRNAISTKREYDGISMERKTT